MVLTFTTFNTSSFIKLIAFLIIRQSNMTINMIRQYSQLESVWKFQLLTVVLIGCRIVITAVSTWWPVVWVMVRMMVIKRTWWLSTIIICTIQKSWWCLTQIRKNLNQLKLRKVVVYEKTYQTVYKLLVIYMF